MKSTDQWDQIICHFLILALFTKSLMAYMLIYFVFFFLRVQEKMQRLGYLRKNTQGVSSVITSDELRQAIRDYQEAFNIPVTGKTG